MGVFEHCKSLKPTWLFLEYFTAFFVRAVRATSPQNACLFRLVDELEPSIPHEESSSSLPRLLVGEDSRLAVSLLVRSSLCLGDVVVRRFVERLRHRSRAAACRITREHEHLNVLQLHRKNVEPGGIPRLDVTYRLKF